MRIVSAPAPIFALVFALTSILNNAGAQANPNRPHAESYTTSQRGNSSAPECVSVQSIGSTASSAVSAVSSCTPAAPFTGGAFTAQGTSSLSNGLFSTNASINGSLNSSTDVQAQGLAYAWNFYTVSDPASVFRIVLATTVNSGASAGGNAQDYAYALGYIGTYNVNASTGSVASSLSQMQRQAGAGGYSSYQGVTSGCSRAGVCTNAFTASKAISTDLFGSDLNSNGIFAAFIEAYAFDRSYDNLSGAITVGDESYAYFDLPTVTLYDVNGNDVTNQHTITQDLVPAAVVATPEPASVVFLATGLVSVFGVARRRRAIKR